MFIFVFFFFFFNDTATTEIYTLSLHDALPISRRSDSRLAMWSPATWRSSNSSAVAEWARSGWPIPPRSEEHTSELQSRVDLVCRLLLEKKKKEKIKEYNK